MLKQVVFAMSMALSACSSSPGVKGYEENKELATANDQSRPDWADDTKPIFFRSNKVYSVGIVTIKGDQRPEAGARAAENNARSNFARAISNRMEFTFQNSEENSSFDSTQMRYIGSEVSSLTSHHMLSEGTWWIRYAQSEDDGSRRIYYKIYSLIAMPEEELKKAIDAAIREKVAGHKLSEDFKEKVNKQWDRFVEGEAQPEAVAQAQKESE